MKPATPAAEDWVETSGPANPPPQDDPRMVQALEEYLAAARAGQPVDRTRFLQCFPEISAELAACLDGLEFIERAGPKLQEADPAAESDETVLSGKPLGDFRILRQIGRGGMGVVYEAEQMSLGRRVALKVLPFAATLDPRQLQRFKNEAHAAAHLHHQHIVPVYAVGEERGVSYYAMQFIDGQTLADVIEELRCQRTGPRADSPALAGSADQGNVTGTFAPGTALPESVRDAPMEAATKAGISTERSHRDPAWYRTVARLGVHAAEGLEHAHQVGIIHRDIKPGNLLVDHGGSVWITDFGLAHIQNDARLTMTGDLVGTLRYMSPEQALAQRVVIDHRSDIYSLGATLYEALTLEPVFAGRDRQELLRQIAFEEPRPLCRVDRRVPTELETIVLKALAKNPAERYSTAQELADDLERFLKDEPIRARRPTLVQRTRKWARRHRAVVTASGIFALALLLLTLAGLVVSNIYISAEKRDKDAALKEAKRNYDDAEAYLELARQAVDVMHTQVSEDLPYVHQIQPYQRAMIEKALSFHREFSKRQGANPATKLGIGESILRVGQIQFQLGEPWRGEKSCHEAIAALEDLAGELPQDPRRRKDLAAAHDVLGSILLGAGRFQKAEWHLRQALALNDRLVADYPGDVENRRRLMTSYCSIAGIMSDRPTEAAQLTCRAIEIGREPTAQQPGAQRVDGNLAGCYFVLGRIRAHSGGRPQAEEAFRQVVKLFEDSHDALEQTHFRDLCPAAYCELARLMLADGRAGEAENAVRTSIALGERHVAHFPNLWFYRQRLAESYAQLANVLAKKGPSDEVLKLRRSVREIVHRLLEEIQDTTEERHLLTTLAANLRDSGDLKGAELAYRKSLALAKKLAEDAPNDPFNRHALAMAHAVLATLLDKAGQHSEAVQEFRRSLTISEQLATEFPKEGDYRFFVARANNYLGIALRRQPKEIEAALRHHRTAIELCARLAVDFPDRLVFRMEAARSHFALGIALNNRGQWKEAESAFRQALDGSDTLFEQADPTYGTTYPASIHNELAWMLVTCPDLKQRNPERAVESARKAVDLDPKGDNWNTLGLAYYRAESWKEAVAALEKSMKLRDGGDAYDWFVLAMAHWKLDDKERARQWYDRAAQRMDQRKVANEELQRFRTEAADLLEIKVTPPQQK